MQSYKKILVIRFSSIGDVILTTPLLKVLKQNFPDSEIDYCTKLSYADVLRFNPNINNIIPADDSINFKGLKTLRELLSDNSYDLVIDAHNNLRTFYLKFFLKRKSKTVTFKKYSFRKFLFVKFKINLMKNLPSISQRYVSILSRIGFDVDSQRNIYLSEIFTDKKSKENVKNILKENGIPSNSKLICIIPSTRHFTKTYPPEYYAELINKFDEKEFSFVLAGKGQDKHNTGIVKSRTGNNVYDLCDKLNLLELTELMKKCSLFISGDTGPMHIADSLNIPLIMIAGSSVREFGFFPASNYSTVIENETLKCRPCTHIGRSECPLGHFKCMREIKPEVVYNEILKTTGPAPLWE